MSSMTKVMQRVREETETAGQTPPAEPEVEAAAPETAEPSAFVAGEAPARPAGPLDGQTRAWDPAAVDPVVVAFHNRYSAICEQFRAIRARLLTMNPGRAPQVIAITSSVPEEGKSVSAVNLGLVMAEGGEHRILIADADFRRTSLARMLGVATKPGLSEVLRGEVPLEAALQATPLPNLKLLPAGEVRDNAYAELLGGSATGAVLDALRARFDYAFLDTPPITTVSDVSLLAPLCNGALVVIEMHRTPEPTVQQAVRTLQANNVRVLGCILSRCRRRGSRYYEHYYSHYYQR